MKKLLLIIFFVLLSVNVYAADFFSFGSSFKPPATRYIYLIPIDNMTSDFLILGNTCLNITGSRLNGTRCLEPASITINYICQNNGDCFLPDTCLNTLVCGIDTTEIEIGEVPATLSRNLALALPVAVSLFFIGVAVVQSVPFVGVFGSIMLMSESWYVNSYSPILAYIMALLSIFLTIFFVLRSQKN